MLLTNIFSWLFAMLSVTALFGGAPVIAGFYAAWGLWNRSEVIETIADKFGPSAAGWIHLLGVLSFLIFSFTVPMPR
jgi:hypothetical protein